MNAGELIDSRYRVDRELGAGGMGVVLAATDRKLGRVVALKLLHGEAATSPVQVARFEREARAAAMLKSEHVVRTLDVGKLPDGAPYIVMELLAGRDLEALTSERPLPWNRAVDYLLQACAAIAEAHANGIVHRDLKPQNLFLAERVAGAPIVKVLDFGISKLENDRQDLTRTRDIMGTPLYMSPEQLRSAKETDARTDLWALGVILYRLVTGRTPFEGETVAKLCGEILTGDYVPLRQLRPDAPEWLERAVDRCLQKDPAARVPSVAELARLLDPLDQSPFARTITMQVTAPLGSSPAPEPAASPSPPARASRTRLALALVIPVAAGAAYVLWPRHTVPVTTSPPVPLATAASAPLASQGLAPSGDPSAVTAADPLASRAPAPSASLLAPPRKAGHRRGGARPANSALGPTPAEDESLPDMRK